MGIKVPNEMRTKVATKCLAYICHFNKVILLRDIMRQQKQRQKTATKDVCDIGFRISAIENIRN